MEAVASHVATALESAMASDDAESYQRQLVAERDRWRLLLEVNNHVIAYLDVNELFRAASVSLRKHFDSDFAGIWIIDKDQNRLRSVALDFPGSHGLMDDMTMPTLTAEDLHRMKTRQPELWTRAEMQYLPATVLAPITSEGIQTLLVTALRAPSGPLGVITLGSRRRITFVPTTSICWRRLLRRFLWRWTTLLRMKASMLRGTGSKRSVSTSKQSFAPNITSKTLWARAPHCARSCSRSKSSRLPIQRCCCTVRREPGRN